MVVSAADLIHLSEGEQWLRQLMQAEDALAVLATVPPDTDLSANGERYEPSGDSHALVMTGSVLRRR